MKRIIIFFIIFLFYIADAKNLDLPIDVVEIKGYFPAKEEKTEPKKEKIIEKRNTQKLSNNNLKKFIFPVGHVGNIEIILFEKEYILRRSEK